MFNAYKKTVHGIRIEKKILPSWRQDQQGWVSTHRAIDPPGNLRMRSCPDRDTLESAVNLVYGCIKKTTDQNPKGRESWEP